MATEQVPGQPEAQPQPPRGRRPDPRMRQLGEGPAAANPSAPAPPSSATVPLRDAEPLLDAALGNLEAGPLLDEVLARLRDALGADTAAVLFRGDGHLRVRAAAGLERNQAGPDTAEGPLATAALTAGQVMVSRAGDDQRIRSALVERLGLGTALAVPMRVEGRPVGVVRAGWFADRVPTPREVSLVQHAADWLGLSLDRARLFEGERAERERAERASRFKTELLAMVGHDFRAPLKVLSRHMQWALDERSSPELRAKSLRTVRRTLGRMDSVLDDILQLAQVDDAGAATLVLHATRFDLGELLRQAAETYVPLADDLELEVAVSAGAAVEVEGDRMRLAQAVADVLTFAFDATGRAGRVDATVRPDGDDAVVSVVGTRAAAPLDEAGGHAGSLWRTPQDAADPTPGTALGLRLADAIAAAHGGRLAVAQVADGVRMELRVPRQPPSPAPPPPGAPPGPPPPT